MKKSPRIEICGNIASGKTTLCRQLESNGLSTTYENFQVNPFYKAFYQDTQAFSFETELVFLLQHYHSIKIAEPSSPQVFDFSLLQDLAYADINLKDNRYNLFCGVLEELYDEIGQPQIVIHLTCSEDVLHQRIIDRSREAEISITIEYLQALSGAINKRVQTLPKSVELINLDSDRLDFRSGISEIQELRRLL